MLFINALTFKSILNNLMNMQSNEYANISTVHKIKGVIFTPNLNQITSIQCFVDAGFAGNYQHKNKEDPNSVQS